MAIGDNHVVYGVVCDWDVVHRAVQVQGENKMKSDHLDKSDVQAILNAAIADQEELKK